MTALKKPIDCNIKNKTTFDNISDKAEIERMKKLISEKIKDPSVAKKAAYIIAEMLNKKD
jgi:hypothetical protein